jgi:hypothetical protein
MILIDEVLLILLKGLEAALQAAKPQSESWIELGNAFEPDGSPAAGVQDRILMSLVSLQVDASSGFFPANAPGGGGDMFPTVAPPLFVDAHVMFAPNFTRRNYGTGLRMMSRIIAWFQETPVLTRADVPELPEALDRLAIEFTNLDFSQQSDLATLTGIKGLPILLYRLRRLPFESGTASRFDPAVRRVSAAGSAEA